jgi:hypothetical protein
MTEFVNPTGLDSFAARYVRARRVAKRRWSGRIGVEQHNPHDVIGGVRTLVHAV